MTDIKEPSTATASNNMVTDTMLHQRGLLTVFHLDKVQAQAKPIYPQPKKQEQVPLRDGCQLSIGGSFLGHKK